MYHLLKTSYKDAAMIDGLHQIAEHVWLFPHDPDSSRMQPCVGVIMTPTQTVLIDAGHSPRLARRIVMQLRDLGASPISHLIYTHYHWDHTFGALLWHAPIVVAHEHCRDLMRTQYAAKPWSGIYIQEEIRLNPLRRPALKALDRAIDDWRNFRVVLPTLTFASTLELYLDGVTLRLRHVGGQHSPDSIIVQAVEPRVLFMGDCYYPPPPQMGDSNDRADTSMMRELLQEEADLFVSGHNAPRTRAEFEALIESQAAT